MTSNYAPAPYIDLRTPPDEFSICKFTTDLSWSCPTASSAILASPIESSAISPPVKVPAAIIELVTIPLAPVVTNVPVSFGIVIVWSAVGLVTSKVVSKSSALYPSKINFVWRTGFASIIKNCPGPDEEILGTPLGPLSSIDKTPFIVSNLSALKASLTTIAV